MLRRKRKKRRFAERSSRLRMINLALLWEKKSLGYSQLNQILTDNVCLNTWNTMVFREKNLSNSRKKLKMQRTNFSYKSISKEIVRRYQCRKSVFWGEGEKQN